MSGGLEKNILLRIMDEKPKALLELVEIDGKICSKVVNQFTVNPLLASAMCYVVYNTLIDCIPEDKQIHFQQVFMESLKEMMKNGHNYMEWIEDK